jgi:hypothetical protein
MCLRTTWKKVAIAKTDKVVFKMFLERYKDSRLLTVCEMFPMKPNVLYGDIYKDSEKPNNLEILHEKNWWDYPMVAEGYHAWRTIEAGKNSQFGYRKMVKCIIPVGSEYVEGIEGDIVSNQIIVTEETVHEFN